MNTINIQEKKEHYIPILKKSGWKVVQDIVQSSIFDQILIKLIDQVSDNKRFTPKYKDIFNAFIECPYENLKVIMIGQDPYPQLGVADGISFSCSHTQKENPSLRYIFDELQQQYPNASRNPDLRRWSNQGVLMLNTALTVQIGKIGSHYSIWKVFIKYLFAHLNTRNDLIIVLLGKKAEEWEMMLNNNTILKVPHPASAAYKGGKWDSKNLFKEINDLLNQQGNNLITW